MQISSTLVFLSRLQLWLIKRGKASPNTFDHSVIKNCWLCRILERKYWDWERNQLGGEKRGDEKGLFQGKYQYQTLMAFGKKFLVFLSKIISESKQFPKVRNRGRGRERSWRGFILTSRRYRDSWSAGTTEVAHHQLFGALRSGGPISSSTPRWEQLNNVLKSHQKTKVRKVLPKIWMQDRSLHTISYKQITSQVQWDVYILEKRKSRFMNPVTNSNCAKVQSGKVPDENRQLSPGPWEAAAAYPSCAGNSMRVVGGLCLNPPRKLNRV